MSAVAGFMVKFGGGAPTKLKLAEKLSVLSEMSSFKRGTATLKILSAEQKVKIRRPLY